MEIIRAPIPQPSRGFREIVLSADRHTLAKLRWRGVAEDGREFGFDLSEPLRDGDFFFDVDGTSYFVSQQAEPVFEISLATPAEGARIGWLIGNLHFSLEIAGNVIRVAADNAVRQMLAREHVDFSEAERVFHPYRHGHVH